MRARIALALLVVLATAAPAFALKGTGAVYAAGGIVGSTGVVFARELLACDGVTDDRATLAGLVVAGGAWEGKAVIFDGQCDALFSTCTTGTGDCTAIDIAPETALLGEPGATIKLAARVCVGGNTPGAACPAGAGDCNGGVCTYDDAANSKAFAHTAAATYTIFRTPANARCSSSGSPWRCCTGSGTGLCDALAQNITIDGLTIAARQVEDYGRCTNGTTTTACRGYCDPGAALANFSCSDDTDCVTGTCVNKTLCPDTIGNTSGECDGASLSPAGTGSIVLVDGSGSAGITVEHLRATDHLKGKGILAGVNATIRDNDLMATSGFTGLQPANVFGVVFYPSAVAYAVTHGIQTAAGSFIERNRVRATTLGIDVASTDIGGGFAGALQRIGSVSENTVTGAGDGAIGIRVAQPDGPVDANRVDITSGDYVFGMIVSGNQAKVRANTIDVKPATDTDGVGLECSAVGCSGGGNIITVSHTTRATGERIGSTSGSCFPNCTGGYLGSLVGDIISLGGGVGFEAFGAESKFTSTEVNLATGQCGAVGQNSQQIINGITCMAGNVGLGANDRRYCNGGTNDGKICKQGTSTGATCTGGTCTLDDFGSNASFLNNRIAFQDTVGIYGFTGLIYANNYVAWQTGRGLVLGDDRPNTGLTAGHFSVTGGILHANAANVSLIAAPDPNGVCTGSTAPLACCSGSGTGTCAGTVGKGTITGVEFISTNFSGIKAIDFATGFDANSPDITEIQIAGNQCNNSSASSICVAFPSSNQSKVTSVAVGQNGSDSATYLSNFTWAMARAGEFVQRWIATGKTLPTSGTTAQFFPVSSLATVSGTESAHTSMAIPGTALSMRCTVNAAPSTPTRILTLRKAGADTGLTCTIASGATECNAKVSVGFTAGQAIAWQANKAAGTATANDVSCVLEYGVDPF